jgi:hypothetical protein
MRTPWRRVKQLDLLGHHQRPEFRGETLDEILIGKHGRSMGPPVGVILELPEVNKLVDRTDNVTADLSRGGVSSPRSEDRSLDIAQGVPAKKRSRRRERRSGAKVPRATDCSVLRRSRPLTSA